MTDYEIDDMMKRAFLKKQFGYENTDLNVWYHQFWQIPYVIMVLKTWKINTAIGRKSLVSSLCSAGWCPTSEPSSPNVVIKYCLKCWEACYLGKASTHILNLFWLRKQGIQEHMQCPTDLIILWTVVFGMSEAPETGLSEDTWLSQYNKTMTWSVIVYSSSRNIFLKYYPPVILYFTQR